MKVKEEKNPFNQTMTRRIANEDKTDMWN